MRPKQLLLIGGSSRGDLLLDHLRGGPSVIAIAIERESEVERETDHLPAAVEDVHSDLTLLVEPVSPCIRDARSRLAIPTEEGHAQAGVIWCKGEDRGRTHRRRALQACRAVVIQPIPARRRVATDHLPAPTSGDGNGNPTTRVGLPRCFAGVRREIRRVATRSDLHHQVAAAVDGALLEQLPMTANGLAEDRDFAVRGAAAKMCLHLDRVSERHAAIRDRQRDR